MHRQILTAAALAATLAATAPAPAAAVSLGGFWSGVKSFFSRPSAQPDYGSPRGRQQADLDQMLIAGKLTPREFDRLSAANGRADRRSLREVEADNNMVVERSWPR